MRRQRAVRARGVEVHASDGLLGRPSVRAGDAGHRDGHVRTEPPARALRHRGGDLGGDGAVLREQRLGDVQLGPLHLVRVRDDSADEARRSSRARP